jgi:hypothetical protein
MSGCQLTLEGHLSVGGDGCGCGPGDGGSSSTRGLTLGCNSQGFEAIQSTECPVPVSTAGAIGAAWAELPVRLTAYQLLSLQVNGTVRLRIGGAPAARAGVGGTFPATGLNGLTFAWTADGVSLSVTFVGSNLNVSQVANQINAAAAGAGLLYLPASVEPATGQLVLRGSATGAEGSLQITTGQAGIGMPTMAAPVYGAGKDLDVTGPLLVQFAAPYPSRIQISGQAKVAILAAGTP